MSTLVQAHYIKEIKETLIWPDATVWTNWKEYIQLGLPSTVIFCSDYWAWQSLAIISGYMGVEAQANFMILTQIIT